MRPRKIVIFKMKTFKTGIALNKKTIVGNDYTIPFQVSGKDTIKASKETERKGVDRGHHQCSPPTGLEVTPNYMPVSG